MRLIVAENGALLVGPQGNRLLAEPVDPALVAALAAHGVAARQPDRAAGRAADLADQHPGSRHQRRGQVLRRRADR